MAQVEQDFIQTFIEKRYPAAIYLTSGIKLTGVIKAADNNALFLGGRCEQLILKSSISVIEPNTPTHHSRPYSR